MAGFQLSLIGRFWVSPEAVTAIELAHDRTVSWQRDLDQRLKELPGQIAAALNPETLGNFLSEALRQQLRETGLAAIIPEIAKHAQTLRDICNQFASITGALAAPECGAVAQISHALTSMQWQLENAANHIRAQSHALAKDLHRATAILCLGAMVVGFFIGVHYAQWINHN